MWPYEDKSFTKLQRHRNTSGANFMKIHSLFPELSPLLFLTSFTVHASCIPLQPQFRLLCPLALSAECWIDDPFNSFYYLNSVWYNIPTGTYWQSLNTASNYGTAARLLERCFTLTDRAIYSLQIGKLYVMTHPACFVKPRCAHACCAENWMLYKSEWKCHTEQYWR